MTRIPERSHRATRYHSMVSILPISVLMSQPPLEHERFQAHRELEALLKAKLRGDVRFDLGSRALYAADSSNYRQLPIGVVLPRDAADVEAALAACRAVGAAVLPRGAGTSLAGQCANVAVVFDYSRYMNKLGSIDPEARLARVEPGIVLDRLREAAERHHLTYAPDPATHSRCTLGGMIGNNSCGVHGLLGGKAADNVESLDLALYDGTRMTVGRTSPAQLEALIRGGGRVGQIYADLARLRDRYAGLIREKFPRIPRRVSGYNLDELLDENGFHVARALVGSEGTCASVVSATLNLTASPPFRVLTVLGFRDAFLAADAVPRVLEHGPIGLEGFDGLLLEFMRRKRPGASRMWRCCRRAADSCWSKWARGTLRKRKPKPKPWSAPRKPGPSAAGRTHLLGRGRRPHLACPRVRSRRNCLRSRRARRLGGLGRCRRSPAQLGEYLRQITALMARVRLPQPALRPLRPGLRAPAHQLRLPHSRRAAQLPRIHRARRRSGAQLRRLALAANTAMARPAPPSCPKCSARS